MSTSSLAQARPLAALTEIYRESSLGERAYETLKDTIIRGGFPSGTKLTVRSVAQALGVSTTPARDAINRLIAEGALVNQGPKTVVLPELTQSALDEVTRIRIALEGLAAESAAAHASAGDIKQLEQMQKKINDALDKRGYKDVLHHNKDFHFHIYNLSNMPRLVSIIEAMWLRIGPSLHDLYPDFQVSRKGVSNHQRAIKALRERDAAGARAAIETDIRDGYQSISRVLKSAGK